MNTFNKDIIGKKFNKLTAIKFIKSEKGYERWIFQCDCGRRKEMILSNVVRSLSTSCGCFHREQIRTANTTHGFSIRDSKNKLGKFYRTYMGAKNRCTNSNDPGYLKYGARGIKFLWESFEDFRKDMYKSFVKAVKDMGESNVSIERLDPKSHYSKENCTWIHKKYQARNRRDSRYLTFNGRTLHIAEWAEIAGLSYNQLNKRIWRKWSVERALNTPA